MYVFIIISCKGNKKKCFYEILCIIFTFIALFSLIALLFAPFLLTLRDFLITTNFFKFIFYVQTFIFEA